MQSIVPPAIRAILKPWLALALGMACATLASAELASPLSLVPLPTSVRILEGSLALRAESRIVAADPALAPLAAILSDEIFTITGVRLKTAGGAPTPGALVLQLQPALTEESYSLTVGDRAVAAGGNYHAVALATATLLQALQFSDGALSLPHLAITDQPAYSFRAVMLDLARKYHSPAGIKQVIELARLYKIPYLHLHLSDDQLFMFPSARFPQLGKSNQEFARFEPRSKPHIEPYTLDELKDLESFAAARGISLVPELDLPGHSGRLIADAGDTFGFPGNGSTVNIASPKTLEALTALLNEVMDVFQSTPYIHLGADEVGLGGLEHTPEYLAAQQKFGFKTSHDLYCKFITDLHDIAARRGKKVIVWEEAWHAGGQFPLPKDSLVMVWSRGRNPNDIAKSGYSVVNATWTPLYLVRDNKKPLDFLFRWQVPQFGREGSDDFTVLDDPSMLCGAELCSWENSESIEIQSLRDRLALVSERAWNPRAGGTFEDFKARFARTDALLEKLVNPISIRIRGALIKDEHTFSDPITVALVPQREDPGLTLKYTLDNSLPNPAWKTYTGPVPLEQTVHLRAGLFDAAGDQHGYLVGSWFRRVALVQPNLATNKPTTVGPGPDRNDKWSSKAAVDGRVDDVWLHWASSEPAPQWLRIDLEKTYPIDYINVITYYDGSRYYQLNAEVSEDGHAWKKVLDFADNKIPATAAGYFGTFEKTRARYVRINMLKNSANPFVHVLEVIVNEAK